jgi:hypothetical protein
MLGPDRRLLGLAACYVALFGNLALLLRAIPWRSVPSRRRIQVGLLAALGFSAAYSLSISWPAFEVMLFPALALVIARAVAAAPRGQGRPQLRLVASAACLALVVAVSERKARHPQAFMYWEEPPIVSAEKRSSLDELAGFVLSPDTVEFYESTTRLIREHSREGERIFAYPTFPEFYQLADRMPATFAVSHFPDVCPDWVAIEDAQRILRSPPPVIVFERLPESFYAEQEYQFRGGRPSGNRAILRALETLKPRYDVLAEGPRPVPTHAPIEVWILKR